MVKQFACEGCIVEYDLLGADKETTVVLLHGFGVNRKMWQPQLTALSGCRVIAVDIRGHGQSRPCDAFTVIRAAEDVAQITEAEGAERPLIVGLSMGGYVAQEYARLYPQRLGGCMICDATPLYIPYKRWEKASLKYSGLFLKPYSWEGLKKLMAESCAKTPGARQQVKAMFDEMSREEFIMSWKGMTDCLHEEDVSFNVPLYFAYGDQDKNGTIQMHAGDWIKYYPNCRVRIVLDAAHVANLDAPQAFNEIMLEFIGECER